MISTRSGEAITRGIYCPAVYQGDAGEFAALLICIGNDVLTTLAPHEQCDVDLRHVLKTVIHD